MPRSGAGKAKERPSALWAPSRLKNLWDQLPREASVGQGRTQEDQLKVCVGRHRKPPRRFLFPAAKQMPFLHPAGCRAQHGRTTGPGHPQRSGRASREVHSETALRGAQPGRQRTRQRHGSYFRPLESAEAERKPTRDRSSSRAGAEETLPRPLVGSLGPTGSWPRAWLWGFGAWVF